MIDEEIKSDERCPYFRYMNDVWYFGMLLTNGTVIGFETIEDFKGEYVELVMLDRDVCLNFHAFGKPVIGMNISRKRVHIKKEHIVAMCELADT